MRSFDRNNHLSRMILRTTSAPILVLLGVVALAAYWNGLKGPYVFDDHNNIVTNPNLAVDELSAKSLWQAAMAGNAGPLKRPLSMMSFAFNRATTGLDPFYFKATNLGIHLINGLLVYLLTRALLRSPRASAASSERVEPFALFATAVWVLHPVQLTSVLYVVQRMTSLCGTFVLLGLLGYVYLRSASISTGRRTVYLWLGIPLATAVAALAKENGVLLIGYAFVIEAVMYDFQRDRDWRKGNPTQFFAIVLVLPMLLLACYLLYTPEWLSRAAETREFNAAERMLTEARVLFMYVGLLFVPAISHLALFYDDFTISRSLVEPLTTLPSVVGWILIAGMALVVRKKRVWYAFAVLWFLVGHAMESTFILLELVHPHRNYIAYLGPILGVTVGAGRFLEARASRLTVPIGVAILVALTGTTALRAYQWRNPLDLAVYEVNHRPSSARANYELARLLHLAAHGPNETELTAAAAKYLDRAAQLAPNEVSALIGRVILADGAAEESVMRELAQRLARRPLVPNQVGALQSLVVCQRKQKCQTPPAQIRTIFASALSNPQLRPGVKADLLTILGMYYAEQLDDYEAALRLMQEASDIEPSDVARRLNVAQILLFLPDYERAELEVRRAQELDRLDAFRWRSRKIMDDIVEFRKAARKQRGLSAVAPRDVE
ncbi:MAG TPA: hypothetical protein PJ986_06995 [Gammaproteobacteria bacterium]|nr:hypothetical protein [Gammaproteobacteria bacterium]